MHWPLYKNYELLKIFKAIDVPIFKQSFNLEINNDSMILVFIDVLHLYKTEKLAWSALWLWLERCSITAERGPIAILPPVL